MGKTVVEGAFTLPLVVPGLLSGVVLAFAKALGEFGATITFVSNIPGETQTLALAIYGYTQTPGGDGPALRLAARRSRCSRRSRGSHWRGRTTASSSPGRATARCGCSARGARPPRG